MALLEPGLSAQSSERSAAIREACDQLQRMNMKFSRFFRANLGPMDADARKKFESWARAQQHEHVLMTEAGGDVLLYAQRDEEKPSKSHNAALRTTISNWKIRLTLPAGFLSLISAEDFQAALGARKTMPTLPKICGSPTICPETQLVIGNLWGL